MYSDRSRLYRPLNSNASHALLHYVSHHMCQHKTSMHRPIPASQMEFVYQIHQHQN